MCSNSKQYYNTIQSLLTWSARLAKKLVQRCAMIMLDGAAKRQLKILNANAILLLAYNLKNFYIDKLRELNFKYVGL